MSESHLIAAEVWKSIPGHDDYDVSDQGRVRSWKSKFLGIRQTVPYILKPQPLPSGYLFVAIPLGGGKKIQPYIHRLVLEAFVGPCPPGKECRHLDGNRQNNVLSNLAWGTAAENQRDRVRHGTLTPWVPPVREEIISFSDPFIPIEVLIDREVWKDILGFPGYQASNYGRIRSRWITGRCARLGFHWRILNQYPNGGYGRLSLSLKTIDGPKRTVYVHSMIIEAFKGPRPSGLECMHIDGNASNNYISNLRWGTHAENMRDRTRHGTDNRGERCGSSKLTEDQVRQILELRAKGERNYQLAERFDVSTSTISDIIKGRTWNYLG